MRTHTIFSSHELVRGRFVDRWAVFVIALRQLGQDYVEGTSHVAGEFAFYFYLAELTRVTSVSSPIAANTSPVPESPLS